MDLFVLMTVTRGDARVHESLTLKWRMTVGQTVTREDVFTWALGNLPERFRDGKGTVVFYSAEPNQFAAPAPEPEPEPEPVPVPVPRLRRLGDSAGGAS